MRAPERILITADAVGGVWTFVLDLGRELTARGIRTTVAVMGPLPTASQRAAAAAAGLDVVARPYRLEWMDDPWDDVERAGEWLLTLEARVKPSVVHLNGYVHAALPWRAPVVVAAHSCVRTWWRAVRHEPPPPSIDRYTEKVKAGLLAAQIVTAPTTAMGLALKAEYNVPLDVRTIPNGLTNTPLGAMNKEMLVLTAGRVWDDAKNIEAVCDTAATLPWPVYVAGADRAPGGEARNLPFVRPLGPLPRSTMRRWFGRASIYALPARYEPFGLSVLEAASAGCALVLGDIPPLRENWDGAALFVDPDDRRALSRAIRSLIAQPSLRTALARGAQCRAGTFAIDRTADGYLQSYQSL